MGKSFDNVTLSTSQSNYIILHELVHVMRQLGWAVLCPMIGQSTEQSESYKVFNWFTVCFTVCSRECVLAGRR